MYKDQSLHNYYSLLDAATAAEQRAEKAFYLKEKKKELQKAKKLYEEAKDQLLIHIMEL